MQVKWWNCFLNFSLKKFWRYFCQIHFQSEFSCSKSCPNWPSMHFIRPPSMLGNHCLSFKAAKFQYIWSYISLFGLYGLEGQIPSIACILMSKWSTRRKISIKWTCRLGPWYLRSPVVCKNHIYMRVVFPSEKIPNQNSNFNSLWQAFVF